MKKHGYQPEPGPKPTPPRHPLGDAPIEALLLLAPWRRRKGVASRTHPAGIFGAGAGFRLRPDMHVIIRFIARDRERGYALRRKSAALTRVRNCSGVSGSEVGAGAGFTAAGAGATLPGLRRGIAQAFGRTDPCPFLGPISRMITSFIKSTMG